jgi:glycosyltransferase A (GT-A) superfamily protein (DUF2064 family)
VKANRQCGQLSVDLPALTSAPRLRAAAASRTDHDAVLHPAHDGGYALLGLTRFDPSLFSGIAWSTSTVAAATIDRIEALGWALHIAETLKDKDVPADLGSFWPQLREDEAGASISLNVASTA